MKTNLRLESSPFCYVYSKYKIDIDKCNRNGLIFVHLFVPWKGVMYFHPNSY